MGAASLSEWGVAESPIWPLEPEPEPEPEVGLQESDSLPPESWPLLSAP